ncbi:hypothetical protein C7974DRAFT_380676 [Boeremia exigua]|uniref:uncharacterized protein n=1 Tax=Boeremia exigua TaxID=749465 RepID=UPI001E8CB9A6|nr:uncharacterized protein C7974DRAFT_380676 [Boeremia exigua]KAH6614350.1 hypothetical protein C7974DRAFT_380676 [Boeremia exigua]
MQFTITLFTLAAATAVNAANAASHLGAWNVTISKSAYANGYRSQTVLADFASDAYAGDDIIRTVCKYEYNPTADPKETKSCEPNTFSYEYDGTTVKVQQNVEKPNPMTVFGEAPLELKLQAGSGKTAKGNAIFDATRAIA